MQQYFTKWNSFLGKNMFLVVLSGLLLGFTLNISNSPMLRLLVIALFGYMTFVTSLTISLKKFLQVLNRPWIPLWALLLIHFVTPITAWLIGVIFYPDDFYTRLGYLVCATLPIGVTSVIWTSLTKGNVATSLVTVTLDTLIAPIIIPLYFKIVIGQSLEIDYTHMVFELLGMITIPSLLGIVLHDWTRGRVVGFANGFGGFTSKICLFFVIMITAAVVAPGITWDLSIIKTLLVTLLLVAAGYLLGFIGSYALKSRGYEMAVTLIYNVGLRNLSFGLVLALTYFPAAAIPITLCILYQQPIAAMIPHLYKKPAPVSGT